MLLKQTVLFYFADRTQMAGESLFFSNFWIAAHALSPRQKGNVRTACGHRARLGLDKQQSQKTPPVSTLLLSVWLQRISSYRFSWVKTNFCAGVNQAKPVPSWPVELEDLSASLSSSAAGLGPRGRTFILGKVERGSNSPAGFPGPGWCNPFDSSTEEIRGGCHRKKLNVDPPHAMLAATFILLNVTHDERQAYSGRHRADSMAGGLRFRRLSWWQFWARYLCPL